MHTYNHANAYIYMRQKMKEMQYFYILFGFEVDIYFFLVLSYYLSNLCCSLLYLVCPRLYLNRSVCCLSSLHLCVTLSFANKHRLVSNHVTHNTEEVWICS